MKTSKFPEKVTWIVNGEAKIRTRIGLSLGTTHLTIEVFIIFCHLVNHVINIKQKTLEIKIFMTDM